MKIEYSFTYQCNVDDLFRALTSAKGISNWWTDSCEMEAEHEGRAQFHWHPHDWHVTIEIAQLILTNTSNGAA